MTAQMLKASIVERQECSDGLLSEAVAGLSQKQKSLSCKFLYDEKGCRLFEQICELEEYYPTRTEAAILRDNIAEISLLMGRCCRLVEFGSGASTKTRLLLKRMNYLAGYVPIDIAQTQLDESCDSLAMEFPTLKIQPICADYTARFELPLVQGSVEKTMIFFPGSTIGNFEPHDAVDFLARLATLCGHGGSLLIGVDLKKSPAVLEPAYNDRRGITAAFNLNLLARLNRELNADFDLSAFLHRAIYDEARGCIEMRLISTCRQAVVVGEHEFFFSAGEYIVTEHSYKYSAPQFWKMAQLSGFDVVKTWIDSQRLFSVHLLRASGAARRNRASDL